MLVTLRARMSNQVLHSLSLLLILAFAGSSKAASRYTELVAFGDSSTDMGNRGIATNSNSLVYPHQTWVKQLAGPTMLNISNFGPSGTSSWRGSGATNYAHGGATTKFTADLGLGDAVGRNLTNQVSERYLNAAWNTGGVRVDALHFVFIGMNDLNFAAQANRSSVLASTDFLNEHARQVVRSAEVEIQALAAAGVKEIVWLNLPNMSGVPAVVSGAAGNAILLSRFEAASDAFNTEMDAAVLRIENAIPAVNLVKFDLHAWFDTILADPSKFGFTNVAGGANDDNYLFTVDRLHPTSHGHAVWAQAVFEAIAIPEPSAAFLTFIAMALGLSVTRWRCRREFFRRGGPAWQKPIGFKIPRLWRLPGCARTSRMTMLVGTMLFATPAPLWADSGEVSEDQASDRQLRGLTYVDRNGSTLKLDLYLQSQTNSQRSPLIIWIHGGGFAMGGRDFCPLKSLTEKGYAVASISYRLSGQAAFPAQIEDCKAAVRWLRSHSNEYNIASDKIGVCGESAGGLLAALLGTAPDVAAWGDDLKGISSRVQAVVGLCPPTDLDIQEQQMAEYAATISRLNKSLDAKDIAKGVLMQTNVKMLTAVLGGPLEERRELARQMSPVTHVTSDDPPFLLVHGDRDELVPLSHSQSLKKVLDQAGVAADLVVVEGAGHGFGRPNAELMAKINAFFDSQLRN